MNWSTGSGIWKDGVKLAEVPVDTAGEALLLPSKEGVSELCRVADLWKFEVDVVLVLRNSVKEYEGCEYGSLGSSSSMIGSSFRLLSTSSSASSCEEPGLGSWVSPAESFDEPDPVACPFADEGSG